MTVNEMVEFSIKALKKLDVDTLDWLAAVSKDYLDKTYELLKNNPNITKEEFLEIMDLK